MQKENITRSSSEMSVADVMNMLEEQGLDKTNFEELVPAMLRAVCEDRHVDAVETFIAHFEAIDWSWYPNG